MKILIVCSANSGQIIPFVTEQGDALAAQGCEVDYFPIKSKGIKGYLSHLKALKVKIKKGNYDIVHAHFGLSGALAVLQRIVPVVITFHNGETLTKKANVISSIASLFSAYNIYVAQHIFDLTYFKCSKKSIILPCGVNLETLKLYDKEEALSYMTLPTGKVNILFGGAFANLRKNVALAHQAIAVLNRTDINLIELKGFDRKQVNMLLCACDLMLLPTKSEGSPQIVKEAMACNCPVVATDIADIAVLLGETEGCYVTSFDPQDVAGKINLAIQFGKRTAGRKMMEKYDNTIVAQRIIEIYKQMLAK